MTEQPHSAARAFDIQLAERAEVTDSLLCVGLDPVRGRMPLGIPDNAAGVVEFCSSLIEATEDLALAYKPNLAFFLAYGADGLDALYAVRKRIPNDIPMILDCKVGDVGSTAQAYASAWFDELGADAITVHPYLGEDSLEPFLARPGKGVIVLAKTSNAGSGDLQDKPITGDQRPVYHYIAGRAAAWDAAYPASVGLVVGATWPDQLRSIREIAPDLPILLPGVGAQGGDVAASVRAGLRPDGTGLLCSSSRGIMYASAGADFADAARGAAIRFRDEINAARLTNIA